jgi:hypothetical protein
MSLTDYSRRDIFTHNQPSIVQKIVNGFLSILLWWFELRVGRNSYFYKACNMDKCL